MRIVFTPDLLTGTAEIDKQHRELIDWSYTVSDPKAGVSPIGALRFLIGYVELHLSAEERVMESAGFPGLASHNKAHAFFRREVAALQRELRTESAVRAATARIDFLFQDWFLQHIRLMDRDMAAWLRQHGPVADVPSLNDELSLLMRRTGLGQADIDAVHVVKASDLPQPRRRPS